MKMIIRKEEPSDKDPIENITIQAFLNAIHSEHTEQFIVRALREAGALSISLVAVVQGNVVGHVAISPVTISDGERDWYGLGPISVLPEKQQLGIGSQLMNKALDELKSIGASGCVLLGEPEYYSRFGFKSESSMVLTDVPAEYFQVLSFGRKLPQGDVTYHDAFYAKS